MDRRADYLRNSPRGGSPPALFETMIRTPMIVLLMRLFGTLEHVRSMTAPQPKSSESLSVGHEPHCPVTLRVGQWRVCVQVELLRDQSFDTNFAIFGELCACTRYFCVSKVLEVNI